MAVGYQTFCKKMRDQQLSWKGNKLQEVKVEGTWAGKHYPFILPRGQGEMNLWPGIRKDGKFPLAAYLNRTGVQAHKGRDHLLSSWTLCANLYFPFGQDDEGKAVLAEFLRARVDPRIRTVTAVELEFEDPNPELKPDALLGETDGSRGANQTSPDVAFLVELDGGRPGLVLTEVKFTEHSFYDCSARRKRRAAKQSAPCGDMAKLLASPVTECPQHVDLKRRYWDHLTKAFNGPGLSQCPAAKGGYQLFRQQALAEGLAISGKYGLVVSAVAWDERNPSLMRSLARAGVGDIAKDWATHFMKAKAAYKTFTHQEWANWVGSVAVLSGKTWLSNWAEYSRLRYGL
ncbi:MAG TPA: hypothetical protein PK668_25870 [Myxococcota bacterium]|nr:hypothetical protein [Myxococcota bacterium]HRY96956.1 hypothetical protein [Myxococcota bacterium]